VDAVSSVDLFVTLFHAGSSFVVVLDGLDPALLLLFCRLSDGVIDGGGRFLVAIHIAYLTIIIGRLIKWLIIIKENAASIHDRRQQCPTLQ
jgi:hypothetical protein